VEEEVEEEVEVLLLLLSHPLGQAVRIQDRRQVLVVQVLRVHHMVPVAVIPSTDPAAVVAIKISLWQRLPLQFVPMAVVAIKISLWQRLPLQFVPMAEDTPPAIVLIM